MPFYFHNGVHCAGGGAIGEGVGGGTVFCLLLSVGLHASLVGLVASLDSPTDVGLGAPHWVGDGEVAVIGAVVSVLMPNGKIVVLGILGSLVLVGK